MAPLFTRAHEETGHLNTVVQENISGMRVVKAFGGGEYESAKFRDKAGKVADHFNAAGKVMASRQTALTLVHALATGAILFYGGREVFAGKLTLGELATFILYMGVLAGPIQILGWRVGTAARALAASRRLFEVLDTDPAVKERAGAGNWQRVRGNVKFEHVSLSYDSSREALTDVDFEVLPGQTVAILGGPGSGKSTIVHLIPRFYDTSSGRILIDGVDVREATLTSLRRNVGIVLQDVFAFSATIRDNIAYGAADASLDEVIRACRVAQLDDFIEGLPEGYATMVGERGVTLSGGQRQRLAIARTILLDPPILVLDDSTSSVDVGTESLIQHALQEAARDRTTFVIAHRLSTVRNADLILVLDKGTIVERGPHEELIARDGYYRRIHDLQLSPQAGTGPLGAAMARGDS
jgi:ATP-binding cassette subfamily B protein